MGRYKPAAKRRVEASNRSAYLKIGAVAGIVAVLGFVYFEAAKDRRALDKATLCPSDPVSLTVLLVDVTDPMNLPQRQDFINQLERLRNSIPRYGKLSIVTVDAASTKLLTPIIERCNPGTAADVTEYTGNPEALRKQWEQGFKAPLDDAFEKLSVASGSERSPILESIQSVALTEFQTPQAEGKPRKLIVASDLLQNTDRLSFYSALPTANELLSSDAFGAARTDLRGIDVELWMLQRTDSSASQPRALRELWEAMIAEEGGNLTRQYRVSG